MKIGIAAVLAMVAFTCPARAAPVVETDANILTAIDESASVGRHGEWLQYNGISAAVTSPEFLEAVRRSGSRGQVGFAVVAWSSGGGLRMVVPWTVIRSPDDAARVAARVAQAPRADRSSWEDSDPSGAPLGADIGGETDISGSIRAAADMVLAAPFPTDRGVINILANGRDNVGSGPSPATAQAVSRGLTVNGVVFGDEPGLADYFRRNVIGGIGSFVESVDADPLTFNAMMVRKFLQDLMV